jgi:Fe-S oxidoreductase
VKKLADRFASHGSPFARSLREDALRAGMRDEGTYFPGCTALAQEPGIVADAIAGAEAAGLPLAVGPLASRCCGYPLYAAGHLAAFRAHAASFAEAARGLPSIVVGDPGCAYTLAKLYPEAGVELPEVKLWVDEVARRLAEAPRGLPQKLEVAYHDPCHLGRGLGRYEAPRAILQHALGGAPFAEAHESRQDAGCSGGGGVLLRTHPETAVEIARRQGEALGEGTTVVTACPAAKRMFEKAGRKALALETVLARFFDADPQGE